MKCDICKIKEAVTSYIEENNNLKKMIYVCEECFKNQGNKDELKCDACGMLFRDFLATGKFGCENCYRVFKAQTIKLLEDKIKKDKNKHMSYISFEKEEKTKKTGKIHIKVTDRKEKLKKLEELLILARKENDQEKIERIEDEIKKLKSIEIEKY